MSQKAWIETSPRETRRKENHQDPQEARIEHPQEKITLHKEQPRNS